LIKDIAINANNQQKAKETALVSRDQGFPTFKIQG
jgi:hypothetical protein